MIKTSRKIIAWYNRPKSKTADLFESLLLFLPLAFLIRTVGFGLYNVPTGSMETTMLVKEGFFADKLTPYFMPFHRGDIISFNDPNYAYSDNVLRRWWQMYAWGPVNITKRIIGLPGDRVKGTIEDGKPVIYVNGKKLDEPYLNRYPVLQTFNLNRERKEALKSIDEQKPFDEQPFYRISRAEKIFGEQFAGLYGVPVIRYPDTPCLNSAIDSYNPRSQADEFEIALEPNQYWVMGDNRQGSWDSRWWGPLDGTLIHGKIVFRLWSLDSDESWIIIDLLKHPIDFWRRVRWGRFLQRVY